MRVIAESFHSTIPLCQLLPCHFGLPRPTLSINLYVKGCLDCTIGAFHMSILSESSLLQTEVQILNAKVAHWTWWWQCLAAWHCRSVWSLPCHFAADAGGSALSMAKSRWHGALRSAHKSCTHSHVFWREVAWREDRQQILELLPGGFHTCCGWKFTATCCWEHVS